MTSEMVSLTPEVRHLSDTSWGRQRIESWSEPHPSLLIMSLFDHHHHHQLRLVISRLRCGFESVDEIYVFSSGLCSYCCGIISKLKNID